MLIPLLLGSRNPARVEITRAALAGLPVRLVTLEEAGVRSEAPEDGRTAVENAEAKARFYHAASGLATLAMDGALHIDRFAADRQPGVMVRRVGAELEPLSDRALLAFYERELRAAGGYSSARWEAGYALAFGDRVTVEAFSFQVLLVDSPLGEAEPGHALDPLMRDPATGRPYTEIPAQERPYFKPIRELVERVLASKED